MHVKLVMQTPLGLAPTPSCLKFCGNSSPGSEFEIQGISVYVRITARACAHTHTHACAHDC